MKTDSVLLGSPAFRMKRNDLFPIIEPCCYLRLPVNQSGKLRNELNIVPVTRSKPDASRRKDVNMTPVYLVAPRLTGLSKGKKDGSQMSSDEFRD